MLVRNRQSNAKELILIVPIPLHQRTTRRSINEISQKCPFFHSYFARNHTIACIYRVNRKIMPFLFQNTFGIFKDCLLSEYFHRFIQKGSKSSTPDVSLCAVNFYRGMRRSRWLPLARLLAFSASEGGRNL